MWKRNNNTYVEENTNRAFQLELLVSQIRLVVTRSDPNRSIETCVQQFMLAYFSNSNLGFSGFSTLYLVLKVAFAVLQYCLQNFYLPHLNF